MYATVRQIAGYIEELAPRSWLSRRSVGLQIGDPTPGVKCSSPWGLMKKC